MAFPRTAGRRLHTLPEVAARLGLSRARVWQLEIRALNKLFVALRDDPEMRELYLDLCAARAAASQVAATVRRDFEAAVDA
jgi:hypothetical protein